MYEAVDHLYTLLAFISPGCLQSGEWTKDDITKKLKEVFPNAISIRIFDGKETGLDTFKMPGPIYKALVSEKGLPADGFIFYFYKGSVSDTATLKKILKAIILTDPAPDWEQELLNIYSVCRNLLIREICCLFPECPVPFLHHMILRLRKMQSGKYLVWLKQN